MNHLPFTLLAYLLNALAVSANKFLLQKVIPEPLVYIFYISLVSFLAVFALPFTRLPSLATFGLASLSTVSWTLGAYLMFKALKTGQVSRVIPVIGTLIPLILLLLALRSDAISTAQTLAVSLLIAGMVFLTLVNWKGNLSSSELILEALSALFFAVSYLVLKQAYLSLDFFSVLVWSRLILLPLAVAVLLVPALRKQIITSQGPKINFLSASGLIFLGGQISGAASELLILFSISLANPALVNSLQGTQYVFLLVFALFLSKKYPAVFQEEYTHRIFLAKFAGLILIGAGLYLLAFAS